MLNARTWFCDYIAWVKVVLLSRGVPPDVLAHHLVLMHEQVGAALTGEAGTLANCDPRSKP